jgi:putative membrane protein
MTIFALLHPFSRFNWLTWSIHPSTVIGLAVLGGLYLWRARDRDAEKKLPAWRQVSFFSSLLVVFASLNGPLHDLSDTYLFSAHMVQHLLLTMLFPPLIIVGVPGWMIRPALRNRVVNLLARKITRPFSCFVIFNLVIAGWHLPIFYNAAMANHGIHIRAPDVHGGGSSYVVAAHQSAPRAATTRVSGPDALLLPHDFSDVYRRGIHIDGR